MPLADARRETADAVRRRCLDLLADAYEEAAMQGLCGEGALEYALDRLRHAAIDDLLQPATGNAIDDHKPGGSA